MSLDLVGNVECVETLPRPLDNRTHTPGLNRMPPPVLGADIQDHSKQVAWVIVTGYKRVALDG